MSRSNLTTGHNRNLYDPDREKSDLMLDLEAFKSRDKQTTEVFDRIPDNSKLKMSSLYGDVIPLSIGNSMATIYPVLSITDDLIIYIDSLTDEKITEYVRHWRAKDYDHMSKTDRAYENIRLVREFADKHRNSVKSNK